MAFGKSSFGLSKLCENSEEITHGRSAALPGCFLIKFGQFSDFM